VWENDIFIFEDDVNTSHSKWRWGGVSITCAINATLLLSILFY
jgi:hypothetical protein